jgi:predicted amino acid dehydrogenase
VFIYKNQREKEWFMMEEKRMIFLAHWVEGWNLLLLPFRFLRKNPEKTWIFWPLFPVCWLWSFFWLVGKRSYDIVDEFSFEVHDNKVAAKTVLLRNFGLHFFLPNYRPVITKRILDTILSLQDETDVIGLGALVKDERITQGGNLIVEHLGDRLRVPIIHGDTLTAAVVFQQVLLARDNYKIKSPVFLTGSTSKIGRAVALSLAKQGIEVLMYTKDRERYEVIKKEANSFGERLIYSDFIEDGKKCALWVTGKAIPGGKEIIGLIPPGGIVINFAVPNPIKQKELKKRKDILSFEAGLLGYDPVKTDLSFTMRLRPGITYACHAATFIHAYMGWEHNEVGAVDITEMENIWTIAQDAGFFLPKRNNISVSKS